MKHILVDTSVWIEFFNSGTSPEAETLKELINNNEYIYMCPPVYQEILQGIRDDKTFNEIKQILLDCTMLNMEVMDVTNYAVDMYRALRKRGITIRKSMDCLISAYAVLGNLLLLYKDRDFSEIAKGSELKIYHHF